MTDLSWERINSSMSVGHSNVLAFVDLVLCFPSSSVCEQSFSRMKYTKTDWRNQLNSSSLSAQLTVMLHMPAVGEFNPTNSVLLWHKSGPEVERKCTESDRTSDVSDSSDSDSDELQ